VLVPLAVAAMAGVLQTYHTVLGRDAGVAMLVLLVAFKMLEMHARRDLFVVVFLCFFLVLTNFFYSQSIATALLMLVSIVALLTTQLSFQLTGAVPPLRTRLLMAQREDPGAGGAAGGAGLRAVPAHRGTAVGPADGGRGARTGLSDSMAPGQFSNLAQSDDPAFRVKFEGAPPASRSCTGAARCSAPTTAAPGPACRRALTLGRRQQQVPGHGARPPLRYQVTMEPSDTRWLFALEMPRALPQLSNAAAASVTRRTRAPGASPVRERIRYELGLLRGLQPAGRRRPRQRLPVAAAALRPQPAGAGGRPAPAPAITGPGSGCGRC
jgi:hypothetical protein